MANHSWDVLLYAPPVIAIQKFCQCAVCLLTAQPKGSATERSPLLECIFAVLLALVLIGCARPTESDEGAIAAAVEATVQAIDESAETTPPELASTVVPARANELPPMTRTDGVSNGSSSTTSGTVQGSFFTRGDENEGATVDKNLITFSFAEDGSGQFQGVLDITYSNGTHILLNMHGPLTWAPTNPQVDATLEGKFTLDSPIAAAADVTTDDAELTISSLEAGSGSLCTTTKCFGFTFPPVEADIFEVHRSIDVAAGGSEATPSQPPVATPQPPAAPSPTAVPAPTVPIPQEVTIDDFGKVTTATIDALVAIGREDSAEEAFVAAVSDPEGVERALIQLGAASCNLIEQVEGDWEGYSLGLAVVAAGIETPFMDLTEFDMMEATAFVTCQSIYLTLVP